MIDPEQVPNDLQGLVIEFIERHLDEATTDLQAYQFGLIWQQLKGAFEQKVRDLVRHLCTNDYRLHELLANLATKRPIPFRSSPLVDLLNGLGWGWIDRRRWKEAELALRRVREVAPGLLESSIGADFDRASARHLRAENWSGWVELTQQLFGVLPDFPGLRACSGTVAEREAQALMEQGRWSDAERFVDQVAAGLPELRSRLLAFANRPRDLLAEAKKLLARNCWDEAREAFKAVHERYPGYGDAAARLAELAACEDLHRQAVAAWRRHEWQEAARLLDEVARAFASYKDAAELSKKLLRCQALSADGEQRLGDLQSFVARQPSSQAPVGLDILLAHLEAIYEEVEGLIAGYGDAPSVLLYLQALRSLRKQDWDRADEELAELAGRRADFATVSELRLAVARLKVALQVPAGDFISDPLLPWPGRNPYDVFRDLGITASSAMSAVGEAALDVQGRGMSPAEREAWDTLRAVEPRLFVDAFLHPTGKADALAGFLAREVSGLALPVAAAIPARFSPELPTLLLLWEEHEQAASLLAIRQREDPGDLELAHRLALIHLAQAEDLDRRDQPEAAILAWRRAIGEWGLLLGAEEYWQRWGEGRAGCYGKLVLPQQLKDLRSRLEEDIVRRLGEAAERRGRSGDGGHAGAYRELCTELRAERLAVRLVGALGGIPGPGGSRVVCGPQLLGSLELGHELAALVARLMERSGDIVQVVAGAPSPADVRRLRQLFSSLRLPVALLEAGQSDPAQVLERLSVADCGECPPCGDPTCPLHSQFTPEIRVCCERCPRFAERNPSYSGLADGPGDWLHEDAVRLATEAKLQSAEERIGRETPWSLQAIRIDWQDALSLARLWQGEKEVAEAIRGAAYHRATALGGEDGGEIERAVALLEAAAELAGTDARLIQGLAERLAIRGIRRANADDHEGAVRDLERAHELAPHSRHIREQCATALAFLGADRMAADQGEALALLDRADALLQEIRQDGPAAASVRQTEDLIRSLRSSIDRNGSSAEKEDPLSELASLLDRLQRPSVAAEEASPWLMQAARERREGHLAGALDLLHRAWELAPGDREIEGELMISLAEWAGELVANGAIEEHGELIASWRRRFEGRPTLAARLDELQGLARVKGFLEESGLVHYPVARQTILLPFASLVVGTLMIRLLVEADAVCLLGSLPPLLETEETAALGNLLHALSDVMFHRPGRIDGAGLALVCRMQMRYLDAGLLESLVRGMARLADVTPDVLGSLSQLQAHLRGGSGLPRLDPSRGGPSLEPLQSLSRSRGWTCRAEGGGKVTVQAPLGLIEAAANDDGVRLALKLGQPRPGSARAELFRKAAALNYRLRSAKLGLDERGRFVLLCELPRLEEEGFAEALTVFAEQRATLAPGLSPE